MPRIALYAHDTYGLGHLRRCLKLAAHLGRRLDDVEGLIVTGSPWHRLFPPPAGFRIEALPPVVKTGVGGYRSRVPGLGLTAVLAERRRRLVEAVEGFRPHLFLVDNVPCGLHGEVLPVLRRLRRTGARSVLVLRDVLDRPDAVRDEWAEAGAGEALEALFDEIWIFGEEQDAQPLEIPGLLADVTDRLHVCGRLSSPRRLSPKPPAGGPRRVLVTGGGGRDAAPLVRTYLEALTAFRPAASSRVVLGPDFPREVPAPNPSGAVRVERFVPDLGAIMDRVDVVVAMAGYNTMCEILESGRPAVLVPRRYPRQEQWLRALRWRRKGRVELLDPRHLTPEALWRAVETAAGSDPHVPEHGPGGRRAAHRARRLLDRAVVEVGV